MQTQAFKLAAGDAWASEATHRLFLGIAAGQRTATIWKSGVLPPGQAIYDITEQGVVPAAQDASAA